MRKSTKVAILVLALVALCSISAMAKGWTWSEADNEWTYEDSYGERVYLEWKKDTNGQFYYLGDDGLMVRNQLIQEGDSTYYVGDDGAKVVNTWKQIEADDEDLDLGVDYRWYYFGSNGKAYKAAKKAINGESYFFDSEGKMLFGYVSDVFTMASDQDTPFTDECVYFCGTNEDGAMKKNAWYQIEDVTDYSAYEDVTTYWVFFKKDGKKANEHELGVVWNGKRYYFQEDGRMLYNWAEISTANTKTAYLNGADEGWMAKKQWIYTKKSPLDLADYDSEKWFWVDAAGTVGEAPYNTVKKINGKYYAFDKDAAMLANVVSLTLAADDAVVGSTDVAQVEADKVIYKNWIADPQSYYFFSNDYVADGSLKTSATFELELADDTYKATTDKTGKLVTGLYNKKFYINGLLMAADADSRYAMVEVFAADADKYKEAMTGATKTWLLLNTAGNAVKDNAIVADADGSYWFNYAETDEDGNVTDHVAFKAAYSYDYPSRMVQAWKKFKSGDAETAEFKVGDKTYIVDKGAEFKGGYNLIIK